MISKLYRLKENEVKKVLKLWKPFFSYSIVLNYCKNNLKHDRFAIIISWKSVNWSVERNFFRRKFYDLIDSLYIKKQSLNTEKINFHSHQDLVFLVKKQTKLEKNNFESIKSFETDINFLVKKIKNLNRNN